MKSFSKVALFFFVLATLFNVSAQEADTILGVNTNEVSIDNYEAVYSPVINNTQNIVLTCYIAKVEYVNSYFTSIVNTNSVLGQKILQDISNYNQASENLNILTFQQSDLAAITYRQQHQLKRDRIVATLLRDNGVAVVSYDRNFYRQHILNE